jgi:hypothetical protein
LFNQVVASRLPNSPYSDLERSAYAFALFTVAVLDDLKKQYESGEDLLDLIPAIDVLTDHATRFQLEMLVEDPLIDLRGDE